MIFKLYIRTGNAAFDENKSEEVARILREVADKIEANGVQRHFQSIRDINGNDVGRFAEKDEE